VFERTELYERVFSLADKLHQGRVPRALVPRIRLQSPKITRKLTTEWFANRVDEHRKQCLSRSSPQSEEAGRRGGHDVIEQPTPESENGRYLTSF
jgi:hypothetical protein